MKLDSKKVGTKTSPMATRTGKEETKRETNMATMKKTVFTHLPNFSTIFPILFYSILFFPPTPQQIKSNQIKRDAF